MISALDSQPPPMTAATVVADISRMPTAQRIGAWTESIYEHYYPLDLTPTGDGFRHGELRILDLPGIRLGALDSDGYMQITDRAKDVIKSGGEWISSVDVENIAMGHPAADICAVIGIPHPKWDERPLLLVKLHKGQSASADDMLGFLKGKIATWWMPDRVEFIDDMPTGPTGKIDKKKLREQFGGVTFIQSADAPENN